MQFKIAETDDFKSFGMARKACALKGEPWLFNRLRVEQEVQKSMTVHKVRCLFPKLPPGFFIVGVSGGGGIIETIFGGTGGCFVKEFMPGGATVNHAVDGTPVGQATDTAVVDEEIGLQLTGEVGIVIRRLFRVVTVYGIELDAALAAPVYCVVEELALATGPENQAMVIVDQHAQGVGGEREFAANLRITVLYYCSIKIDCNYHLLYFRRGLTRIYTD